MKNTKRISSSGKMTGKEVGMLMIKEFVKQSLAPDGRGLFTPSEAEAMMNKLPEEELKDYGDYWQLYIWLKTVTPAHSLYRMAAEKDFALLNLNISGVFNVEEERRRSGTEKEPDWRTFSGAEKQLETKGLEQNQTLKHEVLESLKLAAMIETAFDIVGRLTGLQEINQLLRKTDETPLREQIERIYSLLDLQATWKMGLNRHPEKYTEQLEDLLKFPPIETLYPNKAAEEKAIEFIRSNGLPVLEREANKLYDILLGEV